MENFGGSSDGDARRAAISEGPIREVSVRKKRSLKAFKIVRCTECKCTVFRGERGRNGLRYCGACGAVLYG